MTHFRKKWASRQGGALLVAMGMIFLVGATTSGLFYQGLVHSKFGERTLAQTRALELANSGIELARYTLRHSASDCFGTEISNGVLFNKVPLGDDGYFTVEVLRNPNSAYSAQVVSTGTYTPSHASTKVQAKMSCGYLNALDNYAIVTGGDLFVIGPVSTDNGDYSYNQIHADGSIFFFSNVEVPQTGLPMTQIAPITVQPPEGVIIDLVTTPAPLPTVDGEIYGQQSKNFFPENTGGQNLFHSDGSVTDAGGTVLRSACSPCTDGTAHTYQGYTYATATGGGGGGGGGNAVWTFTGSSPLTPNTTYIFKNTDLHLQSEVGTELNPAKVSFVVEGDLTADQGVSLQKQDTMGNSVSRPIGMLVDGATHLMGDVTLKNTTVVIGGTVDADAMLNLDNSALIAGGDTEIMAINFVHSYGGDPINYHADTHPSDASMYIMDGKLTEYTIGNPTTAPVTSGPILSTDDSGTRQPIAVEA